jgi:hypothetical protein
MDQAAINTGFDFRRYAMTPTAARPRIIIAHVDGSGMAAVTTMLSTLIEVPPTSKANVTESTSRDGNASVKNVAFVLSEPATEKTVDPPNVPTTE